MGCTFERPECAPGTAANVIALASRDTGLAKDQAPGRHTEDHHNDKPYEVARMRLEGSGWILTARAQAYLLALARRPSQTFRDSVINTPPTRWLE